MSLFEEFVTHAIGHFYHQSNSFYQRTVRGRTGIDVMNAEWDNLVILDACRFDTFAELAELDGELTSVISRGSATVEFLRKNFSGSYHDTVYVTANPTVNRCLPDDMFHDIITPWQSDWNQEYGTVLPSDMTEVTIRVHDQYPNKRIIAHYIQPHQPFIGETSKKLYDEYDIGSTLRGHRKIAQNKHPDWEARGKNIFDGILDGTLESDVVQEAYRENLEETLPFVETLVERMQGKTVVTSDHGNLFEQPSIPVSDVGFPHPEGVYLDELVRVPWFVASGGDDRKDVVAESPRATDRDVDEHDISKRLRDLGYLE